ncbi:type II toxin-antitoxin system prevent-host-death family antitoxin [Lichenicoccus sp.]|uniref:type II toxin-antitoxin system prevent-host-death family antitoxin n=1 Tax=Lichenicoccus sp. TaxID=2781899 RepID=UPI003D0B620B
MTQDAPPTDRRLALLAGLDLAATRGLEIGPLHNPILRKSEARVLYVDHVGTAELREKYRRDPHVPGPRIVDVDIVWSGGDLNAACGGDRFDYVVASHVIEHVPDLIGWLAQLKSVLHPDGTVRLIVPDRRYCFDYRRESSSAADVILAARAGAIVPGSRQILDFMLNVAPLDLQHAWSGTSGLEPPHTRQLYDDAVAVMEHALREGAYHDVHCWVFTPVELRPPDAPARRLRADRVRLHAMHSHRAEQPGFLRASAALERRRTDRLKLGVGGAAACGRAEGQRRDAASAGGAGHAAALAKLAADRAAAPASRPRAAGLTTLQSLALAALVSYCDYSSRMESIMYEIQLRSAKATLSAVIDHAQQGEPSIITRHGRREAVVLSFEDWERLSRVPSFGRLLMAAPIEPGDLPERDTSGPREVDV